jgi:hypothetical protein
LCGYGEIGTLIISDGNVKCGAARVEDSLTVPQQVKCRIIIQCSDSSFGYIPKRIESRSWNKMYYRYTVEYYSSIKMTYILMCTTTFKTCWEK